MFCLTFVYIGILVIYESYKKFELIPQRPWFIHMLTTIVVLLLQSSLLWTFVLFAEFRRFCKCPGRMALSLILRNRQGLILYTWTLHEGAQHRFEKPLNNKVNRTINWLISFDDCGHSLLSALLLLVHKHILKFNVLAKLLSTQCVIL